MSEKYVKIIRNKQNDIFFGKQNEKIVYEYIKELHDEDCDVYFYKNKFNEFDFKVKKGKKVIHEYELKSRRKIKFGSFKSLFFGANKLAYADRKKKKYPNRKHTFLWYLVEEKKVYFWDYEGRHQSSEYYEALGWNGDEEKKPCIYVYNKHIGELEMVDEEEDKPKNDKKLSPYKYIPVEEGEDHFTSLGARCRYKISCWKCKEWDYLLFNCDNGGKVHTCRKCKDEYRQMKEMERLKKLGKKPLTKKEKEERDADDDEW